MAKGYHGPPRPFFCRCCKSGPKAKFCCQICGHICKAPWEAHPRCPGCQVDMVCMGDKWRPERKKRWKANARAAEARRQYLRSLADVWRP